VDKTADETVSAFEAGGMVVGEDASADGKLGVLRFHDAPCDFVAEHMGDLFVHIPIHEFAGAEAAGFGLDNEAAIGTFRRRLLQNRNFPSTDVTRNSHE
jgi:hypothetical protein